MYYFLIGLAIGVVFTIFNIINKKIDGDYDEEDSYSGIKGYYKKDKILKETEKALFLELKRQIPENYYIFPNMRLADIVVARDGYGYYRRNNKLMPRHIDFTICNLEFKPIVAIELDGKSHNTEKQRRIDAEKKEILKEAELKIINIKVGENFTEKVTEIISNIR